ncbi:MAG TPA: threonine/serine exporter family protein, partial [Spirochaetales bacterium]|nr:threonine/serine exporter family protein [Spirochaetales bacterium]
GSALISGFFCLLFGGAPLDAVCSALAGALLNIVRRWLASKRQPDFILNIAGGLYAALISALLVYASIASHLDKTSIGIIMLMVPGVTIVNAIRDLISGDLVAGIARAADAFISAAGISIGVGIGLQIWSAWVGLLP